MDERKKIIMEAAKKSFALFGYKGTTVDQIAKIAGIGKGSVYISFNNKEEILREIIVSLIEEMKQLASESIRPEREFYANLHSTIYNVLIFRKEHQLLRKLLDEIDSIGTKVVSDAFQLLESEVISFIKERLDIAMTKGYIKRCNTELTAFVVFKLYIAIVIEWEQKTNEEMSNEEVEQLFRLFLLEGLIKE
ncbi:MULTISPECIES: TetR/AcrR family transcriptional regulator [Sporosarcina]|uniref:TetR/AcrR family transcriptional regulator n=1 Tax=Sporosarcina TaxID=1569 RepID=UPI0002D93272|nr:TetR/AcrR family transcriptional regulator [Sporosarcina newyorkensis]